MIHGFQFCNGGVFAGRCRRGYRVRAAWVVWLLNMDVPTFSVIYSQALDVRTVV